MEKQNDKGEVSKEYTLKVKINGKEIPLSFDNEKGYHLAILNRIKGLKEQQIELEKKREIYRDIIKTKKNWENHILNGSFYMFDNYTSESPELKQALAERRKVHNRQYSWTTRHEVEKPEKKQAQPQPQSSGCLVYVLFVIFLVLAIRGFVGFSDPFQKSFFVGLAIISTTLCLICGVFCFIVAYRGGVELEKQEELDKEYNEKLKKYEESRVIIQSRNEEFKKENAEQDKKCVDAMYNFIEELREKNKKISEEIRELRKLMNEVDIKEYKLASYDYENILSLIKIIERSRAKNLQDAINLCLKERGERDYRAEMKAIAEQQAWQAERERQEQREHLKEIERHNREMERIAKENAKINVARCMTCKKRTTCDKSYCYGYWHDTNAKI